MLEPPEPPTRRSEWSSYKRDLTAYLRQEGYEREDIAFVVSREYDDLDRLECEANAELYGPGPAIFDGDW